MNIAIASGKGGTGKTTVSTNLASYLAQTRECVLTDLDVEEPNSGLFIRGQIVEKNDMYKKIPQWDSSSCALCGNCQAVCNFNAVLKMGNSIMVFPELCHACHACSELCPTSSLPMKRKKMGELKYFRLEHLHFIESRLIVGEEQAVPLIKQTLNYIGKNFPEDTIKILDSPPGTSCPVIEATRDADFVILVTEPTPFGLHDLKLAVETVRKLEKPFAVVINRSTIGNDDVRTYCADEGIDIIATIPNDRLIAQTYSKGELLYKKVPSVRQAVESIGSYLDDFARTREERIS
ncbi:MAG: P-loop NTPase [Sphaerochaetaceae bacterium]